MMTLLQARTRVRYRIGEETEAFWKNVELNSYLNDAKDDLFNAILTINKDYFQRSAILNTRAFPNRVLLPTDFQRLKSLRMVTPGYDSTLFIPVDRNTPLFQTRLVGGVYGSQPYQYMYDIWDCIDVPNGSEAPWAVVGAAVNGSVSVTVVSDTNLKVGDVVYFFHPTTLALEGTATIRALVGSTGITLSAAVTLTGANLVVVSLKGQNLELSPNPDSNYALAVSYCAQLPDLSSDSDTFAFLDPFTGYILDKATYYAFSKGPSGDYQNYASQAEQKLNRILAVASKPNMQGTEVVAGFLEDSY